MMTWITENPWPGLVLLAGIAAVSLIAGLPHRGRIAVVCLLLAGALFVVERQVVTSSEQLDEQLEALRLGFLEESEEQIFAQISPGAPELREMARDGLKRVQLTPLFHLRDIEVSPGADGETAEVSLRANGLLTIRQSSSTHHVATRWRTSWRRESGVWKLVKVVRLNPLTGEEIAVLSR